MPPSPGGQTKIFLKVQTHVQTTRPVRKLDPPYIFFKWLFKWNDTLDTLVNVTVQVTISDERTFRWNFQSQGYQRFLRNEDILPYEKNIAIWIFGPPYFPIVKFHEKWPLKPAIWSYKIKIICPCGFKLHKKVKSNSIAQI